MDSSALTDLAATANFGGANFGGANDPATILSPRRRPTQERSQRKFDAILDAARAVLVEVGFESFTCAHVAERAGVPIGSVYQYFANKYVIVCELDRQDLIEVESELRGFHEQIKAQKWVDPMAALLDRLAEQWNTDPSRRAVWLAIQSTPSTRATAIEHERALKDLVGEIIEKLAGTAEHARLMAEVIVHTSYSIMNYAVQEQRDDILDEAKLMLRSYLIHAAVSTARRRRVEGSTVVANS